MEQLKKILYKKMGLDSSSIGDTALQNALQKRLASCKVVDIDQYTHHLQESNDELHSFIEEIVVPETWFFRDNEPFRALNNYVRSIHSLLEEQKTSFNILSLPTSTGEEPYSIAITLLEAGLKPGQFHIDGIDISTNSLAIARKGQYGRNSFRNLHDKSLLQKYFTRESEKLYSLNNEVKQCVNLIHGNIFELDNAPIKSHYDIIFCRNLLIYFDREKKQQAYKTLTNLLKMDGLLFLGHSESGVIDSSEYVSLNHSRSFAFKKHQKKQPSLEISPKKVQKPRKPASAFSAKSRPVAAASPKKEFIKPAKSVTQNTATKTVEDTVTLEQAKELANNGKLDQAMDMCTNYIKQNISDANGYVLQGLIYVAEDNNAEAESSFRKALYLDPKNREGLVHLSLLLDKSGDTIGADLLKKRIKRLDA